MRFKSFIALTLVVSLVYLGFVQYSFGGGYRVGQSKEDVVSTNVPPPKADSSHLLSQVPKSLDEHPYLEFSKPASQDKPEENKTPNTIPGKEVKKKKSQWWKWVLGALIVVGVGYLIYKLVTKGGNDKPPVEPDYKTNLNFAVYVADSRGQVSTYTLENVMTSTAVTIAIPDRDIVKCCVREGFEHILLNFI